MNPLATELNDHLKNNAPVIFSLLSRKGRESYFPKTGILSQSMQAKGVSINATIGIALEDDQIPVHFSSLEKLIGLDPKNVFPYAGCSGVTELRERWKVMQAEKNPSLRGKATSLPVVTTALSHGLSIVSMLFLDPGDTVIIADKYWGNYNMLMRDQCDVNFDMYPFYEGEGMDLQGLENRLTKGPIGKKVIAMNFPNNPTGYTPTKKEMQQITGMIQASAELGNHLLVICDDAYFGLVYEDDVDTQSVFAHIAGIHKNVLAVKIDGATKEDYVWGFRVGFVTYAGKDLSESVYAILENKTAGGIRSSVSSSPHISQSLLLETYKHPKYAEEKKEKYDLLRSRYEKVKEILAKNHERYSEYFTPLPYNSGYFMCVDLADGINGDQLRMTLIEKFDTGTIFIQGVLRLAYSAVAREKIEQLFENLFQACKMIKK
ncbi:MAG: aminotransferase class I/II-fold pyridoxal phosphate-dependent enzyme [Candidatus Marinimicrobia bacterium]|nr:aminotransferase class I/II-fold pyridoxal phosphate-dependent enzyme [Candidatus Neomarinimicrobiota bacterium]